MASEKQEWPTDPEWRKFAARIADGVTEWINHPARRITDLADGPGCACPLGAATGRGYFPFAFYAAESLNCREWWCQSFIAGFEAKKIDVPHEPSRELGRAYRRRFIDKEST